VNCFHGNCCWGPRYLCRTLPLLFVPVVFFGLYGSGASMFRRSMFTVVAVISILVQVAAVSLHHVRELAELGLAYNVSWSDRQWTMFEPEAHFLEVRLINLGKSFDEMANDKIAPWPTTPNHLLSREKQLQAPVLHYLAFWPFHLTYYLPAIKPELAVPLWCSSLILITGILAGLVTSYWGLRCSTKKPC